MNPFLDRDILEITCDSARRLQTIGGYQSFVFLLKETWEANKTYLLLILLPSFLISFSSEELFFNSFLLFVSDPARSTKLNVDT